MAEGHFTQLDRRFDALKTELHDFRRALLGHVNEISRRLDRQEREYYAITQALRRIESLLTDEHARRAVLEQGVAELRREVFARQARVDDIEARLRP